jgi:alpha-mannosidase
MAISSRSVRLLICAVFLLLALRSNAANSMWQIGKPDGSYFDLAIPGNYPQYNGSFPNDVDYRVGQSNPARDWPFIHPGPGDHWAGTRNHRFRIRFDLASVPSTACRLTIHVVDVQSGSVGLNLEVGVNDAKPVRFATPGGWGDDSLTNPRSGHHFSLEIPFPARHLKTGENTIDITKVDGSWLLYDAITLETGPEISADPKISGVSVLVDQKATAAEIRFRNNGCEGDVDCSLGGTPLKRFHADPGPNRIVLPISAANLGQQIVFKTGAGEVSVPLIQRRNLWRIGNYDRDYSDFAIAGQSANYPREFPKNVNFHVGTSKPERDWPYVHPGPDDWAWAGGKSHPFKITFALQAKPIGIHELVINLIDTQPRANSPVLEVDINGRQRLVCPLPSGGSDDSLRTSRNGRPYKLSIPIPANYLDAGANYISLNVIKGSWLVYDSVQLDTGSTAANSPEIASVNASSTMFFKRDAGIPKQVIRVTAHNSAIPGPATIRVSGESQGFQNVTLSPGVNTFDVLITPLTKPGPLRVTVSSSGSDESMWFEGQPERQWKIYIAASAHTDIGYTDLQEKVYAIHNANTEAAIKAADQIPGFKWNLEVGFQGPLYQSQGVDAGKTLTEKLKSGRLGLGGLYLNLLTGLCSGEELAQALVRPQEFGRAAGAKVEALNLTDVPTAVGTLPMLMSQAGVKYFAGGANEKQGPPFRADKRVWQRPFWWESPDGSRVLALICWGYAQTAKLNVITSVPDMVNRLPGWLKAQEDQPFDAIYFYGSTDDNSRMDPGFAQLASDWNAQYDYPQIIVSRVDEYFHYIEDRYGANLPVIRGDFGSYWEDGAGSSALETAVSRWAKSRLESASALQALTTAHRVGSYDTAAMKAAMENLLFFEEHTWGWRSSVSEPDSEQTRRQWATKSAFALDAAKSADKLADAASTAIAKLAGVPETGSFLVYNEFSWPRDIVAAVPASENQLVETAGETKSIIPSQFSRNRLVFVAEQVPPMGFRAFKVTNGAPAKSLPLLKQGPDEWTWETPDLKLGFDNVTGAIQYLSDRKSGTDWVDTSRLKGLNQFIYVQGGEGAKTGKQENSDDYKTRTHTNSTMSVVENGPIRAVLRIQRTATDLPVLDTYVVLTRGGGLNLINVMHKKDNRAKEAGYFAFPFRLAAADPIRGYIELPYGVLQVDREQPQNACRDWYSSSSFCAISNGSATAYIGSPHSPLFTFNDIFRGKIKDSLDKLNGTVYAYPFNNYWITNYKASQSGDLVFAYNIRLSQNGFDPAEATRFGWESLSNMADPRTGEAVYVWDTATRNVIPHAKSATSSGSLLKIEGGQTIVTGLTWKENGLQLRLYNPASSDARSTISLPGLKISHASRTDLVGAPLSDLPISCTNESVTVPVKQRSITTVILRTGP